MFSMGKIAGLFAIALTTTACVSSNNASQNVVTLTPQTISTVAPTPQSSDEKLNFFAEEQTVVAANTTFNRVVSQYNVVDVQVSVPDYLVVSEANVYVPQADIVWREDPLGDRHAQVRDIMTNALTMGTNALSGPNDVIVAARVNMFHAITEKARNSIGGKHKVRITNHVAGVIQTALRAPVKG